MYTIKKIRKTKIDALPNFDMARYLNSDEAMVEYLNQVIKEGDDALLADALGDIARAKGMTRGALHKALRPNANHDLWIQYS
jgi:probable addiction module antidote protein